MVEVSAKKRSTRAAEQQQAAAAAAQPMVPVAEVEDAFLAAVAPQPAPLPWPEDAFRHMFNENCMDVMVSTPHLCYTRHQPVLQIVRGQKQPCVCVNQDGT